MTTTMIMTMTMTMTIMEDAEDVEEEGTIRIIHSSQFKFTLTLIHIVRIDRIIHDHTTVHTVTSMKEGHQYQMVPVPLLYQSY